MKGGKAEVDRPAPVLAPISGSAGDAAGVSDSAYSAIEGGAVWEMLSLGFFAVSLVSRFLPDWLVPQPKTWTERILIPVAIVSGLAAVGLIFGWIGSKRSRRPGLARIGIFLNAVVLAVTSLTILALYLSRLN